MKPDSRSGGVPLPSASAVLFRSSRQLPPPPPRRRPRRERPPRFAAALAILSVAGTSAFLVRRAGRDAAVMVVRERLLAGDGAGARQAAATVAAWPGLPEHASAAQALALTLDPQDDLGGVTPSPSPGPPPKGEVVQAIGATAVLETAMTRAWRAHDLAAARRVAALAEAWDEPLAPLWTAAVALEAGDTSRALRLRASQPALLASRAIGQRMREVLEAREGGAVSLVRDRSGRLVCSRLSDGSLAFAPGVQAELVPEAALRAVASASEGATLRLSLDLEISRLALLSLASHRGTIVLLEPATGAILAAVSDARSLRAWGTPALEQQREPASIAKLITTAAALRAGLDPDRFIAERLCLGSARYEGGTLWCPHHGPLSGLDEAMAKSCNTAFADLGIAVGRPALLEEHRRFGFDAPPESLMGAAGRVVTPTGTDRQLADLSIGLEATSITPLHAALLAVVAAGGGAMPEPSFVLGSESWLGFVRPPWPERPVLPVIDGATASVLRRSMEATALYGTGAGIAPHDFAMAMKTGTAAEWGGGYHVNYIGLAPLPRPTLAFCVRLTHASSSAVVGRNARLVLHDLLRVLAARARGGTAEKTVRAASPATPPWALRSARRASRPPRSAAGHPRPLG